MIEFITTNPIVSFLIVWVGCQFVQNVSVKILRSITVWIHGYPPEHCDVDGDAVEREQQEEPKPDDKLPNWMNVLGLKPGFTHAEMLRNYRALAKAFHPDKGGDPMHFQAVQESYKLAQQSFAQRA